jgi:phosphatidylserine decarboxylase
MRGASWRGRLSHAESASSSSSSSSALSSAVEVVHCSLFAGRRPAALFLDSTGAFVEYSPFCARVAVRYPLDLRDLPLRIPLTSYGRREILLGSILFLAALGACLWLWPSGTALAALLWVGYLAFFRDPERRPPSEPDALLSPADGVVRDVEQVEPPGGYLAGPAVRIGVFMSVFSVHVNRSPAAGTVGWTEHTPGSYLDARDSRACLQNEHNLVGLQLADGRRLIVNQIAGAVARRIVCAVAPGQAVAAGERIGMIKFGSRVELFLPVADEYFVVVKPGDKVVAGRSMLARYRREGDR